MLCQGQVENMQSAQLGSPAFNDALLQGGHDLGAHELGGTEPHLPDPATAAAQPDMAATTDSVGSLVPGATAMRAAPGTDRRAGPSMATIGLWVGLAGLGFGYLGTAVARPDLLADYSATALRTAAPGAEPRIAVAGSTPEQASETQNLRETISRLQGEVSRLSANVIASEERAAQLSEKVAVLEGKPGQPATGSPASALARKFADAKPAAEVKPAAEPKRVATTTVAAAPAGGGQAMAKPAEPRIINATAPPVVTSPPVVPAAPATEPQPIETGSLQAPSASAVAAPAASGAAAPIAFGAPVVTAAPRNLGVQIANGSSVDALRLSWSLLSERHADSLKTLEPRYTSGTAADGGEQSFDLVAGPIKSEAQAKKVCKTLQSRGVACRVGNFDGNAL